MPTAVGSGRAASASQTDAVSPNVKDPDEQRKVYMISRRTVGRFQGWPSARTRGRVQYLFRIPYYCAKCILIFGQNTENLSQILLNIFRNILKVVVYIISIFLCTSYFFGNKYFLPTIVVFL